MPRALLSAPGCYRLFSYIFFEEVLFVSHINLPGQAPDLPYRVLAQGPLDLPSENFGRDTGHSGVLLISPLHSDLADTANEAEVGGRLNFLLADRANVAVRLFAFGLCFLLRHNASERNFKYKAVVFLKASVGFVWEKPTVRSYPISRSLASASALKVLLW